MCTAFSWTPSAALCQRELFCGVSSTSLERLSSMPWSSGRLPIPCGLLDPVQCIFCFTSVVASSCILYGLMSLASPRNLLGKKAGDGTSSSQALVAPKVLFFAVPVRRRRVRPSRQSAAAHPGGGSAVVTIGRCAAGGPVAHYSLLSRLRCGRDGDGKPKPSGFRIIVPDYCRPGQVICVQASSVRCFADPVRRVSVLAGPGWTTGGGDRSHGGRPRAAHVGAGGRAFRRFYSWGFGVRAISKRSSHRPAPMARRLQIQRRPVLSSKQPPPKPSQIPTNPRSLQSKTQHCLTKPPGGSRTLAARHQTQTRSDSDSKSSFWTSLRAFLKSSLEALWALKDSMVRVLEQVAPFALHCLRCLCPRYFHPENF